MASTNHTALIGTFAALRFTTGAAAWLASNTTVRLIGLSSGSDQPFTTELFGSRELTLAIAIADPVSPQLRSFALRLGLPRYRSDKRVKTVKRRKGITRA